MATMVQDAAKYRVPIPGQACLVTLFTRNREPRFTDLSVARRVACELVVSEADTLAYVVMPDRLHWLVALRDVSLPVLIRRLRSSGNGLWKNGHHDYILRSDEDVRGVARHVIAGPLRAGLVGDILEYPLWACRVDVTSAQPLPAGALRIRQREARGSCRGLPQTPKLRIRCLPRINGTGH